MMPDRIAALAAILVITFVGCSPGIVATGDSDDEKFDPAQRQYAPTPDVGPAAPTVILSELRAMVGEAVEAQVVDGEIRHIEILTSGVDDLVVVEDRLRFRPFMAASRTVTIQVTDTQGGTSIGEIQLVSRHRQRSQAFVALGDSVAAGHGLDLVDYLGGDPCWRAQDAYPVQAFIGLLDDVLLRSEAEFALLACSGYDVDDLWEQEVTGGFPDDVSSSGFRSQLDWAVRSNPRFITLTVGANDTGFVGPSQLFLEGGATLDESKITRRLDVIERDLREALRRLVETTDSSIFITNYYDPTGARPHGLPNCRAECFARQAARVIERLNAAIERVVERFPPERLTLVDIFSSFDGKGAPNGLGPDELRQGGFGILGEVFGVDQLEDIHPYCAAEASAEESWISPIDCVHPDIAGATEIASLVEATIRNHVAAFPGT